MASDTDTAKPDPKAQARKRRAQTSAPSLFRWLPGSRLGRLIILLNVLGLAIIIAGSLVLNELRRGLVGARIDSLTTQGELIVNVINRAATVGEPTPELDAQAASEILQMLSNPRSQRARLFDAQGNLIADSYWVADRVEWKVLPPAKPREDQRGLALDLNIGRPPPPPAPAALALPHSQPLGHALQPIEAARLAAATAAPLPARGPPA